MKPIIITKVHQRPQPKNPQHAMKRQHYRFIQSTDRTIHQLQRYIIFH